METTKICRDCGRELPIERFKRNKFGQPVSVCLDCDTRKRRENKEKKRLRAAMDARQLMLKEEEVKSELSAYNSRQLMEELARRGYKGELTFVQKIDITKL